MTGRYLFCASRPPPPSPPILTPELKINYLRRLHLRAREIISDLRLLRVGLLDSSKESLGSALWSVRCDSPPCSDAVPLCNSRPGGAQLVFPHSRKLCEQRRARCCEPFLSLFCAAFQCESVESCDSDSCPHAHIC